MDKAFWCNLCNLVELWFIVPYFIYRSFELSSKKTASINFLKNLAFGVTVLFCFAGLAGPFLCNRMDFDALEKEKIMAILAFLVLLAVCIQRFLSYFKDYLKIEE
jgi:hypothetical protein